MIAIVLLLSHELQMRLLPKIARSPIAVKSAVVGSVRMFPVIRVCCQGIVIAAPQPGLIPARTLTRRVSNLAAKPG